LLVLLKEGERTPKEMASSFDFTFPALSTHLRVLKEAGLVKERRAGKNRYYSLDRDKMIEMMEFFDQFWGERLVKLKRHVEANRSVGRS
jgi:DNA-binding transcriptional ArsR family regulator